MREEPAVSKSKKIGSYLADGLFTKNIVLVSGLIAAPIVAGATDIPNALCIMFCFSLITFFSVLFSSFVPHDIVYAVRIILYTLIASLVYVPVIVAAELIFPNQVASEGVYIPLMIANTLIVSKSETYFFTMPKFDMAVHAISYILGFDFVCILFALFREILSYGALGDKILGIPVTFHGFSYVFGGFILLGLMAGILKRILNKIGNVGDTK